jgi:hypothetical protein
MEGNNDLLTCCLPEGVPKKYFNYVKGATVNQRSKVARFEQPIVAVKHVLGNTGTGTKPYTITHCTFQSTGRTNISSVNAMIEVGLYVRARNRGKKMKKGDGQ